MFWLFVFHSCISFLSNAAPIFCPGATGNLALSCNSDILGLPPISSPYLMGIEQVSFAANTSQPNTLYPAATINFSITSRTVVRVWDAWFSADSFQLNLNNELLPIEGPEILPVPFLYTETADGDTAFRVPQYAWTEFILDDPSQWTLSISVSRFANNLFLNVIGTGVQQFIETIPFSQFNQCPFFQ